MIILQSKSLSAEPAQQPITPLNAVWKGSIQHQKALPRLGHLCVICPQHGARIRCAGSIVDSDHYLLLRPAMTEDGSRIINLNQAEAQMLILLLSPGFVIHMAQFLDIPSDLQPLLYDMPLINGDMLSTLLAQLYQATTTTQTDEIFMDIVGQVLQLMRLRYQALMNLAGHKERTIHDLLVCLLKARQFITAQYLEPIKTGDVAHHVGLSEFHLARLFRTAFDITVHQLVLRLRMEHARQLLETTTDSITEIALELGYNSVSAFIRAFRNDVGITPSAYRGRFQHRGN